MVRLFSPVSSFPALCVAAFLGLAPLSGYPAEVNPLDDFDALHQAFLERINDARLVQKLSPLRLSSLLSRVAQKRAEEIASGGAESGLSAAEGDSRAAGVEGYAARFLSEVSVQIDGDVDMVFSDVAAPGGALEEEIRRADLRDLGIGIAMRDEIPLYVFVFSLSWEDFVTAKRAEFADLETVRHALLERVNRERQRAGLAPVREEPLLDETAQRHADDMLARSYYGHESKEGSTVFDRSQRAGYRPRFIAENIARGQYSIDEVMEGWMGSQSHRENILGSVFVEIGSGIAVGKNANGYQILWVQCFGRSKSGTSSRRLRPRGAPLGKR